MPNKNQDNGGGGLKEVTLIIYKYVIQGGPELSKNATLTTTNFKEIRD